MSIEIDAIYLGKENRYVAMGIKGLSRDKLPRGYLEGYPNAYFEHPYRLINCVGGQKYKKFSQPRMVIQCTENRTLHLCTDFQYTPGEFHERLVWLDRAGERLHACNQSVDLKIFL